jgi:catechol 2,3-dioxygenase-like lactoylglutathione lyase family enzyme
MQNHSPGTIRSGAIPFQIQKLSHVNFYYKNFDDAIRFFVTGLGFKASDIIDANSPHPLSAVMGDKPLCFLRLGSDHHSSALFPDLLRSRDKRRDTAIQQFSWEVEFYNQVRRGLDYVKQNDIEIDFIGRRMPGSNYNLYFWDPEGFRIEVTWGMEQVGWSGSTKPLAFWDELRVYGKLPDGPILGCEIETEQLEHKFSTKEPGTMTKHSLDPYPVDKWEDTGKTYNIEGEINPRPFRLKRPVYLGLAVDELDAEVEFYKRVLGFRVKGYLDRDGNQVTACEGERSNKQVALLSHSEQEPYSLCLYPIDSKDELGFQSFGSTVHVAFEVEALSELRNSLNFLEEMGLTVLASGRVKPGGDYVIDVGHKEGWVVRMVCKNESSSPMESAAPLWKPRGRM